MFMFNTKSTSTSFAILIVIFAAFRPFPAYAEPLTTISVTAQLAGSILTSLQSGANPYGVATIHNRQMLMSVHDRLSGFDAALKVILSRLNRMPGTVRREIGQALDIDQMRSVRAAIALVESDLRTYREMPPVGGRNRPTPIADASLRLHTLQVAAQKLLNHSNDLILLDALAAMHLERAILAMQPGYSDQQLSVAIKVRDDEYHRRFREMLLPRVENTKQRHESLPELVRQASEQLRGSTEALKILLSTHYAHYFACPTHRVYGCGGCKVVPCTFRLRQINRAYGESMDNLAAATRSEILLDMYWKMIQLIKNELGDTVSDLTDRTAEAVRHEGKSAAEFRKGIHDYFNNEYFEVESDARRIRLLRGKSILQCHTNC